MLSSQVTMIAQTSTSPASSMALPTIALRTSRVSRRARSTPQSRAFRLGIWSSYLDPNAQREFARRCRIATHNNMEAHTRNPSRDRRLPDYAKNLGLKGFMYGARLRGRWINNDPLDDTKSDPKRDTGNGIEDVEESALDKLTRKDQDGLDEFIRAKSRLFGHRRLNYGFSFGRGSETAACESIGGAKNKFDGHVRDRESYSSSQEYEIDPITNRKVFKNATNNSTADTRKSIQVPVKTFKGYRSQFSKFEPPASSTTQSTYQRNSPHYISDYNDNEINDSAKGESKTSENNSRSVYRKQIDNRYTPPVEEGLKDFDAQMAYDEPFGSYKPNQKLHEKPDSVQEGLKSYDSKMSYDKPFMAYEPDGQPPTESGLDPDPVQEGLNRYDSKVSYKPLDTYEPYRKDASSKVMNSKADGLEKFDAKMCYGELSDKSNSQVSTKQKPEESPDQVQEGLKAFDSKISYDKPHMVSEADGQSRMSEKRKSVWDYIPGYNIDRFSSPEPKDNPVRESLGAHESRYPYPESRTESIIKDTQPDNKDTVEDGLKRYDSRHSYGPVYYKEPFVKPSNPFQPSSFVRSSPRKMTGNFVRDFPEEFETKWTTGKTTSGTLVPEDMKTAQHHEFEVQNAEKEFIDGLASKESFSRKPDIPKIQTSLDRGNARYPSTGEDKTMAQSRRGTTAPYTKAVAHQGEGDLSVLVSSYGASRREKLPAEQSSSEGQESIMAQNSQGLINQVRSIYEEKYGTIDLNHRQIPQAASIKEATGSDMTAPTSETQEPTIYKILAYDPTMQSVSIAETTSIVTDSASPLTPAEVLLRLSNPAKFFPHFEPLQSQGYEIVSGSGDVLVFRKVRATAPPTASRETASEPKRTSTNPIDGMQSSPIAATGNFASPTGFVNHDLPIRAEPAFKSNIDVRREEPVFSGKRNWYDDNELPKRETPGLGRRLVTGAVGFGAFAYATGVVIEFFTTGGVDGLGPQSF